MIVVVWLHWTVESFFFNTSDGLLDGGCEVNVNFVEPTVSSFLAVIIGVGATVYENNEKKIKLYFYYTRDFLIVVNLNWFLNPPSQEKKKETGIMCLPKFNKNIYNIPPPHPYKPHNIR